MSRVGHGTARHSGSGTVRAKVARAVGTTWLGPFFLFLKKFDLAIMRGFVTLFAQSPSLIEVANRPDGLLDTPDPACAGHDSDEPCHVLHGWAP